MYNKLKRLKEILAYYGQMTLAFSGGVDSVFLLAVAKEVLGDGLLAVTMLLKGTTTEEKNRAKRLCQELKVKHILLEVDELKIDGFAENPADRCYICKRKIFNDVINTSKNAGIDIVADGSNHDDIGDYRPGMKALKEYGVVSPLLEAGLTKADIRALSKEMNLPTWDLPSSPCLSSRIPYGERITHRKLDLVRKGELLLKESGFNVCRVRAIEEDDSLCASLEVEKEQIERLESMYKDIEKSLLATGFDRVRIDSEGFKSGKLNKAIL